MSCIAGGIYNLPSNKNRKAGARTGRKTHFGEVKNIFFCNRVGAFLSHKKVNLSWAINNQRKARRLLKPRTTRSNCTSAKGSTAAEDRAQVAPGPGLATEIVQRSPSLTAAPATTSVIIWALVVTRLRACLKNSTGFQAKTSAPALVAVRFRSPRNSFLTKVPTNTAKFGTELGSFLRRG